MRLTALLPALLALTLLASPAASRAAGVPATDESILRVAAWGGTPADPARARLHRITHITLHHQGEAFPPGKDPQAYMRNLQAWSRNTKQWIDVPYHYAIDLDGRIYEGRDLRYAGDTNTEYDPLGHALIEVMGNYEEVEPNQRQLDAVVDLMTMLAQKYKVPPERIAGHRDHSAKTVCPGKNLHRYLANGYFRERVAQNLRIAARQPQVELILANISPERIRRTVEKLAGFHTRHTMSETESATRGIGAARRWIQGELERCSAAAGGRLQVTLDSHVRPAGGRLSRPTEIVNVVATLPGSQPAARERIYVVSGHYDSRASDVMDEKSFAPGANDDASGTAAVMELACVMARQQFDATLVFLAVAAEEHGLFGAAHWAEGAKQKGLNIAGMFTNDIIGSSRSEDGTVDNSQVRLFAEGIPAAKELSDAQRTLLATGGENDTPTRQLARMVKEIGERYVDNFRVTIVNRRDRYLRGGDHIPFLERGYAALRFTEPAEDFRHQHQDVRQENGQQYGDLPEFVDPDYIARVARVNAAVLATLAQAPAVPQKVVIKTGRLENDTELVWQANGEPDLLGYRIVWRETTAAQWQGAAFVGNVTGHVLKRSKDNLVFGVQAVDRDGNTSPAAYPMPQR